MAAVSNILTYPLTWPAGSTRPVDFILFPQDDSRYASARLQPALVTSVAKNSPRLERILSGAAGCRFLSDQEEDRQECDTVWESIALDQFRVEPSSITAYGVSVSLVLRH